MRKAKYILILAGVTFLLHLTWENAQAPLYEGYQSFIQHFPICLIGAIGDVVITLLVLSLLLLLKKYRVNTPADFIAIAVMGFLIAVIIEQHAILSNKWDYTSLMPRVPLFDVGLTPVLQMTILLPLSFYITNRITNYYEKI